MSRELRIGFIGAGAIALTHAKYLSRIEGIELTAAADPSPASLNKFAEAHSTARTFTDPAQMLKETKLDAVCVCSPNSAHLPN
ncbi:MAG: Gfo/Idh/MocA family oxidoreductase, partial [Phycisphaerae bacterium]|nr:Gfo/Idh/MocA family oxidoreductase [Phycisphaerae bacterium]